MYLVETYISTMQSAIRSAERPAIKSELYDMSLSSTGGQYATYEPVVTPEAQRAYEALSLSLRRSAMGSGRSSPGQDYLFASFREMIPHA